MASLRIYRISDKYIHFLHSRDSRVQYNKNCKRPYVGVVLFVGEFKYFVPMESPKPNHANIKPGKHIFKMDEAVTFTPKMLAARRGKWLQNIVE